jgi:hypothetical protein
VCWNSTRVNLWLLCNVHFVQSADGVSVQAEIKWSPSTAEDDVERFRASFLHIVGDTLQRECLQLSIAAGQRLECCAVGKAILGCTGLVLSIYSETSIVFGHTDNSAPFLDCLYFLKH